MAPLRPGLEASQPWEMGQREMRALLDHEAIAAIPGERPDHDIEWSMEDVHWIPRPDGSVQGHLRLVVDSDHTVRVEPVDA